MKFGQYLEQQVHPPWKNEYIQYNLLKCFLKENQLKPNGWSIQDENYFVDTLLERELRKANGFIYLKTKQIRSIMHHESEHNIRHKISELVNFTRLNATGFQKILKKHDKHTFTRLQSSERFRIIPAQFGSHETNLNQILHNYPIEISKAAIAAEKVTTTKYWIHPDNLTQVQALLLFNMPIVDNNESSTIYFDNPNHFPLYSNVLERNESAETIRAKWYGPVSDTTDIYFEKKTHHESWLHNKGLFVKHRFSLKLSQVNNYMAHGQCRHSTSEKELASSIYQSMNQQKLKPTLRCYHHRATYHEKQSPFRISLDTKIAFMKELGPTWRRIDIGETYPFSHLSKDDVYFFPYAVLETKFTSREFTSLDSTPEWFNQLVESQLVYEVPYFSKYLQGASYFFRKQLPMLPWWLSEMNVDIRRNPTQTAILSPPSSDQRCAVVEPDCSPDYFRVATMMPTRRSKEYNERAEVYENGEKLYAHRVSSCTMIDHFQNQDIPNKRTQHGQLLVEQQQQQHPPATSTPYDKFLNSSIMIKIKQITQEHDNDGVMQKDEHYIGLLPWFYAKITNDQSLYVLPPQPNKQLKKAKLKKIEPKIFFANERTFISWLQFSALLLSVSLGLINFGDHISRGSGAFFIMVAIILAGYAQLRYQYRAWQIRFRGGSRFDDIYGPAVLCFVLVIALIVNLGLRVSQPLPTNPSPFGYNTTTDADGLVATTTATATATATATNTAILHGKHPHFENGTMLDKHGQLVPIKKEEEEEDENEIDEP